jgi:high-affinity Fe2+/Pb2+ permease
MIALTIFMVVMTNLLFLIGAGLFSRSVWSFQWQKWITLLGINGDDTLGDDPGTYPVQGTVWHLNCCNPNNSSDNQGWSIFNAILGWTNTATCTSLPCWGPSACLCGKIRWLRIILCVLLARRDCRISVHEIQGGESSRATLVLFSKRYL